MCVLQQLQDIVQDKIAIIKELNVQLEQRTKKSVELEGYYERECAELKRYVS